jgi:3-hydroxyisobutyrate dehydrogenase-like beta-hydroxyacid dehydrogenase
VIVGFIGLGSMGGPIASNLLRAGMPLRVFDILPERIEPMVAAGARAADMEEIAQADLVCASLPGPQESEEVALGDGGLLARMTPGSAFMSLSTISVESCQRLQAAAESRGVDFIDSPVTGAADGARDASLVAMVGADATVFARLMPVFDAIAKEAILVGRPPAGTAAKLLTNMLWFINTVALAEALALGAAAGLPPEVLGPVVKRSAGSSWVAHHDLDNILSGDDDPSFSLGLCCKDLGLLAQLESAVGYSSSLAEIARQHFNTAMEAFGSRAGELAVTRLIEKQAGASIRSPIGQP